jgi:serine/threonine protein kinase
VLHQIGIGALGPVFRTYEPNHDRLVAVKVFRLDIVPEQAQALAQALGRATESSLFHPSIVEPVAAGMEGTLAYRAEEYVAAESLDVAMRHYAPAPLEKVLPFITQLAGAIDFARAAGVGHGGLHPRDIFVTPDEARATGFGVVEALEEVGIRAPTRRPYAAPERVAGASWGTAADVFSLAAITYELMTGRRPSGTGTQIGALPEAEHGTAIHAVLARAMDDDPSKRFATALAFAGALESAGRGAIPAAAAAAGPAAPRVAEPTVRSRSDIGRRDGEPLEPPAIVPPPAPPEPPRPALVVPPIVAAPAPVPPPPPAPTPGEFDVEKELDPLQAAIHDDIASERELDEADHRLRFDDDEPSRQEPIPDISAESAADLGEGLGRFPAEEFGNPAERELDAPIYATPEPEPEPELFVSHEEERSHVLPYAVILVVGLLGGFGAAWFLMNRGGAAPPAAVTETAPTATQPAANAPPAPATSQAQPQTPSPTPSTPPAAASPASGAATSEKPGQYSEQKVTPAPSAPKETARPAPAAPTRGRLVVTSTPSRAGVTVNGTWRGRTPLTLDNLAFGTYAVRIVQPGFAPAREDVTLSARNASPEISKRLERAAAPPSRETPSRPAPSRPPAAASAPEVYTGLLYVDSRPRGATVFVDNKNVGVTPLMISDVKVGSHVVRFEMAGKKPWSTSTRVVAGQTARVTGSLEDRQ